MLGSAERAINTVASLLRVPLLLWGLGIQLYGLYVAILGIVATARLLDFGLHYGVLNRVAAARGRDDADAIRATVSTAFFLYGGIAVAALLGLTPLVAVLPLEALLGVPPDLVGVARLVVWIALFALVLPIPLKVFSAAIHGFQQQYLVSLFNSVSTLAQLGLLALVVLLAPGRLLWVAGAVLVSEALHWCLFAVWVRRRRPELAVRRGDASRRLAPSLLSAGMAFFVINVANLMKFSLASPIVSHALGPAAVPGFSVPWALFMAGQGVIDLVATSFWAAYGEASARQEWSWVGRAFILGTKAAVGVATLLAVLGWLYGDTLVELWTGGRIVPSRALLGLLGTWLVAQAGVAVAAVLLSGLDRYRVVMWNGLVEGALTLVLALWLIERWGVTGVAGAMAATSGAAAVFLLTVAVPAGTARRVAVPWRALAALGASALAAAAVGWGTLRALAGSPELAGFLVGVVATAATFGAAAWLVVLDGDERRRTRDFFAGRLASRRRPPHP